MKRAWIRWTIRIGLGISAAVAVMAGFAVCCLGPQNALLLILIVLQPLISNRKPPPIVADQIEKPKSGRPLVRDLTPILQQKFPVGTREAVLRRTLLDQGFRPPTPPPVQCWPQGKPAPVGQVIFPCPIHDVNKTLEYTWGMFPCSSSIFVWWETGAGDDVTQIGGHYHFACL
jgi:hypothetical protein